MSTSSILAREKQIGNLTLGLALFSMFFGAGNLIFPLLIGKGLGNTTWYAVAGLGLTAVLMPFLGLATMVLYRGDYHQFFYRLGKTPGMLLLLLLQLILGPFGVIPRLVSLMHGMAKPYLFDISAGLFSIITAVVILACCYNRKKIIPFLGFLTPFLLLGLMILVFLGIVNGTAFNPVTPTPMEGFLEGLIGGYNTMDLIAAFMFATIVLPYFQKELRIDNPRDRYQSLLKKMGFPIFIAASLLFLTYVGLCFISAYHGWSVDPSHPAEQLLSAIAIKLLGPAGGLIAVVTVILACLTTATTLTAIFAEYLSEEICKKRINTSGALLITLAITTFFANLGFGGIAAFLGPVLTIVYPGLILLTVLNLLYLLYDFRPVKWPVFLTFGISAVRYFLF